MRSKRLHRITKHIVCLVTEDLPGFNKWINETEMDDINVAAFDDGGLQVTDGFHVLTTPSPLPDPQWYYNAYVCGHGSTDTHTSYGYLAGYDCKFNSDTYFTDEPMSPRVVQWRSGKALDLRSIDRGFNFHRNKAA